MRNRNIDPGLLAVDEAIALSCCWYTEDQYAAYEDEGAFEYNADAAKERWLETYSPWTI